jgi:hypothetical protein
MKTGKEDIPVMLDSLQELFHEHGDTVTPTLLVRRMEQKLHKRLRIQYYILFKNAQRLF